MLSPLDHRPQLPGPVPMFILPSHPCRLVITYRVWCQQGVIWMLDVHQVLANNL